MSVGSVGAELALRDPEFERRNAGADGAMQAFRRIEEAGGRWLRVVYRMRGRERFVITVFMDRKAEKLR